mgnify:CR=1 FL=1
MTQILLKNTFMSLMAISLYGCASHYAESEAQTSVINNACIGSTHLTKGFSDKFDAIIDTQLLSSALGSPNKGKLCQGQVYKSKEGSEVKLYRAWNSTNPNSQFGNWWAFEAPSGEIAKYRSDYEICYQWSPIDTLVSCTLKPETKVVIGTGQSAECSDYLTYPVSATQQIYIENASSALSNCTGFKGEFSWK